AATKGLPPRRLAPGEPLGTLSLSADEAQDAMNKKDAKLFTIDDATIDALATKASSDYGVGFLAVSQQVDNGDWVRGAMKRAKRRRCRSAARASASGLKVSSAKRTSRRSGTATTATRTKTPATSR